VTGVDDQGRSCVVEEKDVGGFSEAISLLTIFATDEAVPGPRPVGHGDDLDLGVAPGLTRWYLVHWPPNSTAHVHHTDTVDYDAILQGSITLILGDGEHPLHQGDCVVITGVDHDWRAGPDGCIESVVLLGSTPPA
jgi:mannose-6-phosphate isomerase-like protein (cupin superfamily)